jgi:hypothetical protein
MVFNATFNNISAISWQSVLLMEENGVPGENNRPTSDEYSRIVRVKVKLIFSRYSLLS